MKLERFDKHKKYKKVVLFLTLIIIGFVVGIYLYHSFAYFEETKSFNIIEGKVPTINKGDIKFAVYINDEKSDTFPAKGENYHLVKSDCSNGASATWNEVTWSSNVTNLTTTNTKCNLYFEQFTFDYGDGSLNTVSKSCTLNSSKFCETLNNTTGGYVDKLYLYNTATGVDTKLTPRSGYYTGNLDQNGGSVTTQLNTFPSINTSTSVITIKQGENEFAINNDIGNNNSIIILDFWLGNAGGKIISDLQIYIDSAYYTLKSAVVNKKIKPLVVMNALSTNGQQQWVGDNPVNLYDGGTMTGYFMIPKVYFMLEEKAVLSGVKFTINSAVANSGGRFSVYKLDNQILHLK